MQEYIEKKWWMSEKVPKPKTLALNKEDVGDL